MKQDHRDLSITVDRENGALQVVSTNPGPYEPLKACGQQEPRPRRPPPLACKLLRKSQDASHRQEAEMKAMIAFLAILFTTTGAFAQRDYASGYGPFTSQDAELMSAVWPKIREAARFEDIDWRSVGLARAPGDRVAHSVLAEHWGALRKAAEFEDIDWSGITGYRESGRDDLSYRGLSPFTSEESAALSRVWGEIRKAADFRDIDWHAVGLRRAPGDSTARSIMETQWHALRQAARFEDIDWGATTARAR